MGVGKKQVINEAYSNVKNCKMIMIPSLKLEKFVNWKEQHGGTNIKPCSQDQNERNYKKTTRKTRVKWQKR